MFKRIANLFRGFIGLFISGLERQNPEALLDVEKENLRAQIAKYNQGLATHAALIEQLMTQIKRLEAEEQDLRAKTTVNLRAGNREIAAQYAMRLQTVTTELADNRKQLEQSEKTYQELVKARDMAVTSARQKIDMLKRSISDMKIQQAQAELTEMASGMISEIGGAGDTLNRLHEMVEEERTKAARTGAGGARFHGYHRHPYDGSRTEGAGRSGAGRFRREGRHRAGAYGYDYHCGAGGDGSDGEIDGTGRRQYAERGIHPIVSA